ncbi:MAG: repeat-containing protein [Planctomycetaceae bacterium]|nr:repeat-containing protein [Planctomycetaceae bacterium]
MFRVWFLAIFVLMSAWVATAIGDDGDDDLNILIQRLSSTDFAVQNNALFSLHVGAGDATLPAIPAIVRVVRTSNLENRIEALELLAEFKSHGRAALPAIQESLSDKDPKVRLAAGYAIVSIDPRNKSGIAVLSESVRNGTHDDRMSIPHLIQVRLGLKASGMAPALIATAVDPAEDVRASIARALGDIGSAEQEISAPALRKMLQDVSPMVRVRAAESLWLLDEPAETLVPLLIKMVVAAPREEPDRQNKNFFAFDEPPERLAADLLGKIGPEAKSAIPALIDAMKSPRTVMRFAAVDALAGMGAEGEPAIEALSLALRDTEWHSFWPAHRSWSLSSQAATALRQIGPASRRALLAALDDKDNNVRSNAADAFGHLPAIPDVTVPALIKALSDEIGFVRSSAAVALGRLGAAAVSAAPDLAARLGDNVDSNGSRDGVRGYHFRVGDFMRYALMKIQPPLQLIMPSIINSLRKSKHLSGATLKVLRALGPQAKAAVPVIEPLFDIPEERLNAALALARINPDHPALLPLFRSVMTDAERKEKYSAAQGLADLNARAIPLIPELFAEIKRQDYQAAKNGFLAAVVMIDRNQTQAIVDLAEGLLHCQDFFEAESEAELTIWSSLGADAKPALPNLVAGMRFRSPEPNKDFYWTLVSDLKVRLQSSQLLYAVAPQAPELIEGLIELCQSDRCSTAGQAADLLAELGPSAAKAAPVLVALLSNYELYVVGGDGYGNGGLRYFPRDRAVIALGKLGPAAVPALQIGLGNFDPLTREYAAQALGVIGPPALPAAPDLRIAIKDRNRLVRAAAAQALGRIDDKSEPTLIALTSALSDSHLVVRVAAITALGDLGPAAQATLHEINRMQNDKYKSARAAAIDAVKKIQSP